MSWRNRQLSYVAITPRKGDRAGVEHHVKRLQYMDEFEDLVPFLQRRDFFAIAPRSMYMSSSCANLSSQLQNWLEGCGARGSAASSSRNHLYSVSHNIAHAHVCLYAAM